MTRACLTTLVLTTLLGTPLLAQTIELSDSEKAARAARFLDPNDARQTRQLLQRLLGEHPPSVRLVLQTDPSLLNNPTYMAAYPRVEAFLKQHPEIARDPAFFFGAGGYGFVVQDRSPQERALSVLEEVLVGLALFIGFLTVVIVLASLIRQAIEHRRWLRQSRVQTDVHGKILDRLQSNDDLLAYIQTPAGRRFLESGPSPQQEEPRTVAAPLNRILWSVQLGVMLVALGVGLWLVQRTVMPEIAPAFHAMGVVTLTLGLGAVVSAGTSWFLSSRLGLFGTSKG
jgi:hypothetical protein